MNDEDFARTAFAHAFSTGFVGEPTTLPDLDRVAAHGRQARRNRQGLYAAGTVALAGAVTAGVVGGPSLLGLGTSESRTVTTGQPGTAGIPGTSGTSSASSPEEIKPSPGVRCQTMPQVDWTALVSAQLPAGATATPLHDVNCVELPDGSKIIEAMFTLSGPAGILQIDVNSGQLGAKAHTSATPSASASGAVSDGAGASKLDALGRAAQSEAEAAAASREAAAAAAAKAATAATAGQQASTASPAVPQGTKVAQVPSCAPATAQGVTTCIADIAKGGYTGIDVQLFETAKPQLVVDVIASTPKPTATDPSPKAPLTQADVVAIAQAVASHF